MTEKHSPLLPCPFCNRNLVHESDIHLTRHPKLEYGDYCPAGSFMFASDRQDIIAAWNTRAVNGLPEAIAALETAERIIGRKFPNGQATADIRAALTKLKG